MGWNDPAEGVDWNYPSIGCNYPAVGWNDPSLANCFLVQVLNSLPSMIASSDDSLSRERQPGTVGLSLFSDQESR